MIQKEWNNPWVEKFPAVKNPSGKQVKAKIVNNEGKPNDLYISDEVAGKLHLTVTCKDMWIDIDELKDALQKVGVSA